MALVGADRGRLAWMVNGRARLRMPRRHATARNVPLRLRCCVSWFTRVSRVSAPSARGTLHSALAVLRSGVASHCRARARAGSNAAAPYAQGAHGTGGVPRPRGPRGSRPTRGSAHATRTPRAARGAGPGALPGRACALCNEKTGNFHGNLHTPRHPPTRPRAPLDRRVGGRAEAPSGRAESQSRGGANVWRSQLLTDGGSSLCEEYRL